MGLFGLGENVRETFLETELFTYDQIMTRQPEDAERRRLKAAYKKAERDEARSHMVLDADQLDDLLAYVEAEVEIAGCDHSLRATRAWAVANDIDPEVLAESLEQFGGYCDCEVALNVNPEEIFG